MSALLKEVERVTPQLNANRLKQAEVERNWWVVNAEERHVAQDIEQPVFWAHVANQLRPFDRVEVRAHDGSWFAECIVLACERNWARVRVLYNVDLGGEATATRSELDAYLVEWKGPHHKWSVIRKTDGEYIKDGFQQRVDAEVALREHLKAL